MRMALSFLLLLVASACVSVPVPPDAQALQRHAANWHEQSGVDASDTGTPPDENWWHTIADPVLGQLITMAWENNYDIKIAQARLQQEAAGRQQARALLLPSVGAQTSYTWTEQSLNSPAGPSSLINAGLIDRELEFWNASIEQSWEIDLFGANRYQVNSATARMQAAMAARHGAAQAVLAQVVSAYVEYHGFRQRLDVLARNTALQEASLVIIERRADLGLESRLAVRRAAGQLATARAGVPGLRGAQQAAMHRLTVLLDVPAGELDPLLHSSSGMLALPAAATGIKSELLMRRPDVAVAELMMQASAADVGVAKANLFPRFALSAVGGYESSSVSSLINGASRSLGIVPQLSAPLFQGGRLRAQRDAAQARWVSALANYQKTVVAACADAEIELARYYSERRAAEHVELAFDEEQAAAELAQKLYERGLLNALELIDARRRSLQAEDEWIRNRIRQQLTFVNLYIALGGGWQSFAEHQVHENRVHEPQVHEPQVHHTLTHENTLPNP
ncbi:MAG: efflux transporter outer membrane subunit [Gammaproteobacteria bacterium]|nr:efflux transporter outer membrane subunit [Gammaproteobacteria bacterium]